MGKLEITFSMNQATKLFLPGAPFRRRVSISIKLGGIIPVHSSRSNLLKKKSDIRSKQSDWLQNNLFTSYLIHTSRTSSMLYNT